MMYADTSCGRNFAKDPAVVKYNGVYYLYYSMLTSNGSWQIGVAAGSDLDNFTKIGEVTPNCEMESRGICAPAAMLYNDQIHLFYQTYGNQEKDAICHAYSDDGIHFIRNRTNPIVRASGSWNNGRAIDADVVLFQDRLYLYFATRDPYGKIQMQGVSRCKPDGLFARDGWAQCCDAPVLKPELDWEQQCIEAAAAIEVNDRVYMFYAGAYNNSPQQIGVAVSDNGVDFERLSNQPFLRNGDKGTWNESESGHPYVFRDDDGRIYLFYQGNCDGGKSWYISKVEIEFSEGIPRIVGDHAERNTGRQ